MKGYAEMRYQRERERESLMKENGISGVVQLENDLPSKPISWRFLNRINEYTKGIY